MAARNMDGELDARKVTVKHLTVFAIEPEQTSQKLKFISIMWPGFIGTLTAFNEGGLYSMMNTGRCKQGAEVVGAYPVSISLREVVHTLSAVNGDPTSVMNTLNTFASSGGGISVSGTIFHFARNYVPQNSPPAFFFEGDKYGGVMRLPGQVDPLVNTSIMGSNHNRVYGVDTFHQDLNFGVPISFSSHWRYKAGQSVLESWDRTGFKADVEDMKLLLKTVSSGVTEHAVVWKDKEFWLANANSSVATIWDAPYLRWTKFSFVELFGL